MSDTVTKHAREKSLRVTFISQADEDNALAALDRLSRQVLAGGKDARAREDTAIGRRRGVARPAAEHG